MKYEENISKDRDVDDLVRALLLYCQVHTCYLTLSMAVQGRLEDLDDRVLDKGKVQQQIEDKCIMLKTSCFFRQLRST